MEQTTQTPEQEGLVPKGTHDLPYQYSAINCRNIPPDSGPRSPPFLLLPPRSLLCASCPCLGLILNPPSPAPSSTSLLEPSSRCRDSSCCSPGDLGTVFTQRAASTTSLFHSQHHPSSPHILCRHVCRDRSDGTGLPPYVLR